MSIPMFVSAALSALQAETGRHDLIEKIRTHIADLEQKRFMADLRVKELETELQNCYEAATRGAARPVWRKFIDSLRGL